MRVVYWGTYDRKRERYRILIDAFRRGNVDILECHEDVWSSIRDKSMVSSWRLRFHVVIKYIFAYLKLIGKYVSIRDHDAVFIGYLGHFDVIVLWPFAKLRQKPIIWDALISLYDTVILDRKLFPASHPLARILFFIEWLGSHSANKILMPSNARAFNFKLRYGLREGKTHGVFLGVETMPFPKRKKEFKGLTENDFLSVIFYGQFIPMHGVDTIVHAARLMQEESVEWIIIGSGQVERQIRDLLAERPLPLLKWIPWVPYTQLADWIHRSDIALGIFGDSEKAATSIPNKVFQILSTGTPLITRDSPAIREILMPEMPGVYLVPPNDPAAIVDAIHRFQCDQQALSQMDLYTNIRDLFRPEAIGGKIMRLVEECL